MSSRVAIIPTVLAYNKKDFNALFAKLLPISNEIQIDVMDGEFVETKSVGLDDLPDVSEHAGIRFEAHLMVERPDGWIAPLARKGFDRVIVHYEAVGERKVEEIATYIRSHGMEAVLAINPDTAVELAAPHAGYLDGILIMGVYPGRNNAPYVSQTPQRVHELAKLLRTTDIPIQIDGGMTPETIAAVVHAGARRINSGSFVANAHDPKEALAQLRKAAQAR